MFQESPTGSLRSPLSGKEEALKQKVLGATEAIDISKLGLSSLREQVSSSLIKTGAKTDEEKIKDMLGSMTLEEQKTLFRQALEAQLKPEKLLTEPQKARTEQVQVFSTLTQALQNTLDSQSDNFGSTFSLWLANKSQGADLKNLRYFLSRFDPIDATRYIAENPEKTLGNYLEERFSGQIDMLKRMAFHSRIPFYKFGSNDVVLGDVTNEAELQKYRNEVVQFLRSDESLGHYELARDLAVEGLRERFEALKGTINEKKLQEKTKKEIEKNFGPEWAKTTLASLKADPANTGKTDEELKASLMNYRQGLENESFKHARQEAIGQVIFDTDDFEKYSPEEKALWDEYRDSMGYGALDITDENWDTIMTELAVNAPLILVSGGVANIAVKGLSMGARSVMTRAGLKLGSNLAIKASQATLSLGIEGTVFEMAHHTLAAQDLNMFNEVGWQSKIFWSSLTLGAFKGVGKLKQTAIMKGFCEKITAQTKSIALSPSLNKVLGNFPAGLQAGFGKILYGMTAFETSRQLETSVMFLTGAAQATLSGGELDKFYENLYDYCVTHGGENYFHSMVSAHALNLAHKGATPLGKKLKSGLDKIATMARTSKVLDTISRRTVQVLKNTTSAEASGETTKTISLSGQLTINRIKSMGIELHPYDEAFIGEMGFDGKGDRAVTREGVVTLLSTLKQSGISLAGANKGEPLVTFLIMSGATKHTAEIQQIAKSGVIESLEDICLLYEKSVPRYSRNGQKISTPPFEEISSLIKMGLIVKPRTPAERMTMVEVCGRLDQNIVAFFFAQHIKLPRNSAEYSAILLKFGPQGRRVIETAMQGIQSLEIPYGLGAYGFDQANAKMLSEHIRSTTSSEAEANQKLHQILITFSNFYGAHEVLDNSLHDRWEPCNLGLFFARDITLLEPFLTFFPLIKQNYQGSPGGVIIEYHNFENSSMETKVLPAKPCIFNPERLRILLGGLLGKKTDADFHEALTNLPAFKQRDIMAHVAIAKNGPGTGQNHTPIECLRNIGVPNDSLVTLANRFRNFDLALHLTVGEVLNSLIFWSTSSYNCAFAHEHSEPLKGTSISVINAFCKGRFINPGCGHPELNGMGELLYTADRLSGGNGTRFFPLLAQIIKNDSDAAQDAQNKSPDYKSQRGAIVRQQQENARQVRAACRLLVTELEARFPSQSEPSATPKPEQENLDEISRQPMADSHLNTLLGLGDLLEIKQGTALTKVLKGINKSDLSFGVEKICEDPDFANAFTKAVPDKAEQEKFLVHTSKYELKHKNYDPKYVLLFRRTLPSEQPKHEERWTNEYMQVLRGLRTEIPIGSPHRYHSIILCDTLEHIVSEGQKAGVDGFTDGEIVVNFPEYDQSSGICKFKPLEEKRELEAYLTTPGALSRDETLAQVQRQRSDQP